MRNGPSPWGWAGTAISNAPEGHLPARHHNTLKVYPFPPEQLLLPPSPAPAQSHGPTFPAEPAGRFAEFVRSGYEFDLAIIWDRFSVVRWMSMRIQALTRSGLLTLFGLLVSACESSDACETDASIGRAMGAGPQ